MHINMEPEQQEQQQPLRRQEAIRPPSVSNLSTHRKQIKFYMEVAVLLMVAFMLLCSVLKALFTGGDVGLHSEQISGVLRLVNNLGQGFPAVGAVSECPNGTRC